jgi:chaperone modulatory protein CbpM
MRYGLTEVCELLSLEKDFLVHCLREHWIEPADPVESWFDHEDVARLRLIRELRQDFGVNDEAVPIILRLIDQLHYLRLRVRGVGGPLPGGDSPPGATNADGPAGNP